MCSAVWGADLTSSASEKENVVFKQAKWYRPEISAPARLRQGDCKLEASLDYNRGFPASLDNLARPCLKL